MGSDESVSKAWRRRERSLAVGIVVWAVWVSAMLTLSPEVLSQWALETDPLAVAGSIMITIGLSAGFIHSAWAAFDWWAEPAHDDGLTEVPWDE